MRKLTWDKEVIGSNNDIGGKMKAVGFHLGRTLVGYENIPLSWESLYEDINLTLQRLKEKGIKVGILTDVYR